jgi:hypothetical protein
MFVAWSITYTLKTRYLQFCFTSFICLRLLFAYFTVEGEVWSAGKILIFFYFGTWSKSVMSFGSWQLDPRGKWPRWPLCWILGRATDTETKTNISTLVGNLACYSEAHSLVTILTGLSQIILRKLLQWINKCHCWNSLINSRYFTPLHR